MMNYKYICNEKKYNNHANYINYVKLKCTTISI